MSDQKMNFLVLNLLSLILLFNTLKPIYSSTKVVLNSTHTSSKSYLNFTNNNKNIIENYIWTTIQTTQRFSQAAAELQQTTPDTAMIAQELSESQWDYVTEIVFILFLAVLSIPANIFLFTFFTRKIRRYKKMKHFNLRYASIANSFHAYVVEICFFDTINVIYLILNSTFHLLYLLKKTQYESVFDISNFACKFFIYILRISGAMSNYLVFLVSLNR